MAYSNKVALGCCQRCESYVKNSELYPDPNYKGIRCCSDCLDKKDPWRMPAVKADSITLQYPRPDVPLNFGNEPEFLKWDTEGLTYDSGLFWDELKPED